MLKLSSRQFLELLHIHTRQMPVYIQLYTQTQTHTSSRFDHIYDIRNQLLASPFHVTRKVQIGREETLARSH